MEMRAECWNTLLRYGHYNDKGDADRTAQQFTEDGIWQQPGGMLQGRDKIRQTVLTRPPGVTMRIMVTNFVLTPHDDDHADGSAYYTSYRDVVAGGPAEFPRPLLSPAIVGEYTTKFVRRPEGWLIAYHKAERIFQSKSMK